MKKGTEHAEPVISMRNIKKEFSGVKALDGITFGALRRNVLPEGEKRNR